jgi:4-hydroxy-tetrahydrodipicolinate synthase
MTAALAGDFARARLLHYRLFPLIQAMFFDTNPVPAKTALALMGKIKAANPRLPICAMSSANLDKLTSVISEYGLI